MLADLHLDDADGLDVVAELRRRWDRAVPAALITADRDPTLRLRARARQVDLLHKPIKPAALRALLRLRERALHAASNGIVITRTGSSGKTLTTTNDGLYTDAVNVGTYSYKVCEAATGGACSPTVSVTVN